jgi:hypothetical protein
VIRSQLCAGVLVAVSLVACGGGDDADAGPYVDSLTQEFQHPDEEGGIVLDGEYARCAAERTVDVIGADTLEDADVSPEEFAAADGPQDLDIDVSDADAHALAQVFTDCGASSSEMLLGPDAPAPLVECVDEHLDEDALVDLIAAMYQGNETEANAGFDELFNDLAEACPDAAG